MGGLRIVSILHYYCQCPHSQYGLYSDVLWIIARGCTRAYKSSMSSVHPRWGRPSIQRDGGQGTPHALPSSMNSSMCNTDAEWPGWRGDERGGCRIPLNSHHVYNTKHCLIRCPDKEITKDWQKNHCRRKGGILIEQCSYQRDLPTTIPQDGRTTYDACPARHHEDEQVRHWQWGEQRREVKGRRQKWEAGQVLGVRDHKSGPEAPSCCPLTSWHTVAQQHPSTTTWLLSSQLSFEP